MRKIILFSLVLIGFSVNAQTVVYSEDFESTLTVTNLCTPTWNTNNLFSVSPNNSYHSDITSNSTTCFTTDSFSTTTNSNVILSFSHICKIEFFDSGIIEVSSDNGQTWIPLTDAEYLGSGAFGSGGNKFSSVTYSTIWNPADNFAVPQINWWQYEEFDISALVADFSQVKVKFILTDGNGNGNQGNYGWLIDDIQVVAAFSELIPPVITMIPPFLSGNLTGPGPYTVTAEIIDDSGVDTAMLVYSYNNGSNDTLGMNNLSGDLYTADLPEVANIGDEYCYSIYAIDASPAINESYYPSPTTCTQIVSVPIPPEIILGNDNQINTGTTWPAPYGNWYWGSRHQFLVLASELQALNITSTEISKLAFNVVTIQGTPLTDFTIKIGHSSAPDFSSLTWEQNLTTVYYEPIFTESQGWNEHPFTTPFIWDGVSNLVIETCFNNTSYTNNAIMELSDIGIPVSQYYYTDASGVCSNSTLFNNNNLRPNIKFWIGPPPANAMSIYDPQPNNSSCGFSQNESITITMVNSGTNTQTGLYANYSINSGAFIQEQINTNLNFGDSLIYTFNTLANLSIPGIYTIDFYVTMFDTIMVNSDTIQHVVENNFIIAPFNEDFETFTSTTLSNGWEHVTTGILEWVPNQGPSWNFPFSGPVGDHTTGTGVYLWDIQNFTSQTEITSIESPCIDLSQLGSPQISFWYHMSGFFTTSDGMLVLEVLDSTNTWNQVWMQNSDQGLDWKKATVSLTQFADNIIKIRFTSTLDNFTNGEIALDDISIDNPPANDVGVSALISPNEYSCGLSSNEVITIQIINFGTDQQDTIPLSYSVNGGTPVTELLYATLNTGASINHSFSTTADMSTYLQTYNIDAWVGLSGDQDNFNDTLSGISLINASIVTYPSLEDFSGFVSGSGASWDPGFFANGWERTPNPLNSFGFSWLVQEGQDFNITTGPMDGYLGCGNYLMVNGFDGLPDSEATLVSPCINTTSHISTQLEFYYHMFGSGMGNLYIDVYNGSTWVYSVDSIVGQQQFSQTDPWLLKEISLAQFSGNEIKIQFRAVNGQTNSDIAIDNILIYDQIAEDVGVVSIMNPSGASPSGSSEIIEIVIKNYGTNTITSLDVSYNDGSGQVIENWTGFLTTGSTTNFIFSTPYTIPNGLYNLCAETQLINDGNVSNNQYCIDYTGVGTVVLDSTYFDDFESNTLFYKNEVGSCSESNEWEYGSPTYSLTPYSGIGAWATDLDDIYQNNADYYLYSPYFDFSNIIGAELSFWHKMNCENNYDGGRIDYTTDGGQTWNVLGSVASTNSSGWYNNPSLISTNMPGWSSLQYSGNPSILLDFLNGTTTPVQFRFNFSSDASGQYAGWAIDDFMIYIPPPDCFGDIGGTAYIDTCGVCVEGNTGITSFYVDAIVTQPDCYGDIGELFLNVSGGITPYTTNLGNIGTNDFLSPGTYQLSVSDGGGCSFNMNFDINDPQLLDVSVLFSWPLLSADVTGGNGGLNYEWYWNNLFFGQTNQSFEPNQNGSYWVAVTDQNGCTDSSDVYNYNGSGIKDIDVNQVFVYPNPFKNLTKVFFNTNDEYSIKIYSIDGLLVKNIEAISSQEFTLDLSLFKSGIYFICFEKNGFFITRKKLSLID